MAFTTSLSALSAADQAVIKANAASNKQTPEQYLASRGGINPITHQFGDSFNQATSLSDAEYLAAAAKGGAGINAATAAKTEAAIASGAIPNPKATTTTSTNTSTGVTDAERAKNQANVSLAIDDFRASLKMAGLDSLVDTIDSMIKGDMTAAQIKINLVGTQAYKDRFPAMASLAAAGRAVNEATYIAMERGYTQVLGAYGLDIPTFGSRAKLGTYISNEVSPAEFESRVQMAADRVNKNSDVTAALQEYYGVSKGAAIGYLLDPTLGMDIVKKEVRAAEIGAAAASAGFKQFAGQANVGVAESFINASGTQDLQSLKTEFGKSRLLADTQTRLSEVEGDKTYNDLNAVTAVLGQDQQALLQSQRRAAREAARFSGGTGLTASSLKTESTI